MQELTEKQLEIVHDHYKETFSYIREREKARDRQFLWIILLFALLFLEVGYPAEFGGSVQSLSIVGGQIDLDRLPLPALLSATWVLTLAITLRYCAATVSISRQYKYLHALESELSPQFGGGIIYNREGNHYLEEYPPILNFVYFAYVMIFPVIVLFAILFLSALEWFRLSYPWPHRLFDTLVAGAVFLCFFLYQMQPYLAERWDKWMTPEPITEEVVAGPPENATR